MKRIWMLPLLLLLLLPLSAFAADGDLSLRIEALKDHRSAYTSAIDLYDLELLTGQSAETERLYREMAAARRRSSLDELFDGDDPELVSGEERVQAKAVELGLFLEDGRDKIYYRPPREARSAWRSRWLAVAAIALLCFGGFLFSSHRYQRKKRRR